MVTKIQPTDFYKLLDIGHIYEKKTQEIIKELYKVEVIETRDDNKYDFLTSDNISYECKYDKASERTGNYYIEYMQNDKFSGIKVCEANNYILINDNCFVIISSEKLREIINDKKYLRDVKMNRVDIRGKPSSTRGYIINKEIVVKNSSFIKNFDAI
jgi:hypothetical protein